jgi:hypothetical protein
MGDDEHQPPPPRTARLITLAADAAARVNPASEAELKELYAQLVEAIIALHEVQKKVAGKPTSTDDRKLRDLDQGVEAIIGRINAILG